MTTPRMSKESIRVWHQQWRAMKEAELLAYQREKKEGLSPSPLYQTLALIAAARRLLPGWPDEGQRRETEVEAVRQRWNRLRHVLGKPSQGLPDG